MELIHTIYEPGGSGPYPTVLALHGRGANGFDLLGLAPHIANGQVLMICPQGPVETPIGPETSGYSWYPHGAGTPNVPAIASARRNLELFLEQAQHRYPIDRSKLVALGFSQGGVMAYALALSYPERFAGLVALSSWLPVQAIEDPPRNTWRSLPALVHHGAHDSMIQVGRARDAVEKLREWRVPVTYREYDMGHEITPRSLSDLSAWIEESVLGRR